MKNQKNGFTLIEVLVSLTIFVVGVVLVFPIFSGGIKAINSTDNRLIVATLAQSKLAEIKAKGFISPVSNVSRVAFNSPYDDYDYEINWSVVANDITSANPVLEEVQLIIYWSEGAREQKEIFKTYLAKES